MLDRHYNFLLPLFIITGILPAEDAELPLRAAIDSALEHNLDLRIATYAPVARLTRLRSKKLSSTHHSLLALLYKNENLRLEVVHWMILLFLKVKIAARKRVLISVFQPVRPLL